MTNIIFPGTFDPFTKGHQDLVERASKIFDKVTIVCVINKKKNMMFSLKERVIIIEKSVEKLCVSNVEVVTHEGMIIDFCKMNKKYLILRGLRNNTDLGYEYNMSIHNDLLCDRTETICMLTNNNLFHISSSAVRELLDYGHFNISHLVVDGIEDVIKEMKNYENI